MAALAFSLCFWNKEGKRMRRSRSIEAFNFVAKQYSSSSRTVAFEVRNALPHEAARRWDVN